MTRARLATAAFVILLLAGCSSPSSPSASETGSSTGAETTGVETDFITPGVWDVRGNTDYLMAWAHNLASRPVQAAWSITGLQGAPLPAGWTITSDKQVSTLASTGSKVPQGQGGQYKYPDWDRAQFTLKIPADAPAGNVSIELHAGEAIRAATVVVHEKRGTVAGPGAHVWVDTVGTYEKDGTTFWSGAFDTVVGEQGAVEGVSWGLMGATAGETVALHAPPPFAYGYDNPPTDSSHYVFNGETLVFTMKMTKWS